jgi:hypothetical protein
MSRDLERRPARINEARTPATIMSGQGLTESLFIASVSLPALAFGQPVDVYVENNADDYEPEGQELGGEPEVEGEIEKVEPGQDPVPMGRFGKIPDEELEPEGQKAPGLQDDKDDADLSLHVSFFGLEDVDFV